MPDIARFGKNLYVINAVAARARCKDIANQYFSLGLEAKELGRNAEAAGYYLKAIEYDPRQAEIWFSLGLLNYRQGDINLAASCYRTALAINPNYPRALFGLGNCLKNIGEPRQAAIKYTQAILLAPDYSNAHYNLAQVYEKMRDARKALRHYEFYLLFETAEGDPEGGFRKAAQRRIEILKRKEPLRLVLCNVRRGEKHSYREKRSPKLRIVLRPPQ